MLNCKFAEFFHSREDDVAIGLIGFLPKEKMQAGSVQELCTKFAKSFSLRDYKVDFHANEGGAVGFCSHPGSLDAVYLSDDKKIVVVFVGEILDLEGLVRHLLKASADAADLIMHLYQKDLLSAISNANGLFCACVFDSRCKLRNWLLIGMRVFQFIITLGSKNYFCDVNLCNVVRPLNTSSLL